MTQRNAFLIYTHRDRPPHRLNMDCADLPSAGGMRTLYLLLRDWQPRQATPHPNVHAIRCRTAAGAIPGSGNAEPLSLFHVVRAWSQPPGFPFGNTPAITYQRCSGGGVRNDEAGLASTRTRQMITGPKPPPRFPCLRLPVSIVPISGTRDIATFPRSLLSGSSFPQRAALEKGNRI